MRIGDYQLPAFDVISGEDTTVHDAMYDMTGGKSQLVFKQSSSGGNTMLYLVGAGVLGLLLIAKGGR